MGGQTPSARLLLAASLVLACAIRIPPVAAQGTTYYVATTGTDGPGCGTIVSPCETIQYAAALVGADDTVLVNPGTYAGGITVEASGTAGEPITFRANGPGVVINGSGGERDDAAMLRGLATAVRRAIGLGADEPPSDPGA